MRPFLLAFLTTMLVPGAAWAQVPAVGPAAEPTGTHAVASPGDLDVFALPRADLIAQARADLGVVQRHAAQVQGIVDRLRPHGQLFREDQILTPDDKQRLRTSWGALYGHMLAIEAIRQRWWSFGLRDAESAAHAWGYVVTHTALLAELGVGSPFAAMAMRSPAVEVLLDEADDSFGVPARAFEQWKLVVVHVATATQLLTGDAYLAMVRKSLKRNGIPTSVEGSAALAAWARWSEAARKTLGQKAGLLFWRNGADLLKDWSRRAVLPPQKAIAEWMGDTRVRRQGQPLIGTLNLNKFKELLQPGDLVLARQNWYLSNIGLPGFWPHAELVLGRPEHWAKAFDADPEVRAWLAQQPEQPTSLAALVAARFPKAWAQYTEGTDYQGRGPIWVMESISEGVSLTAPEHAFQVDYAAALRPNLPPLVKAQAILRAFGYHGRPYDFDFDFLSDRTLVCTELVWKSYQPERPGAPGLAVELVEVAGRKTLPANEIARWFDATADRPDAPLQFVAFLEGQEDANASAWRNQSEFRATWQRVKWDVAQ